MIKKASILNVYLAFLPYAASLTLIKDGFGNNFLVAILVSLFLFIQFSPHNLGGSSLIAVIMTILFGLANLRSGNAGRF